MANSALAVIEPRELARVDDNAAYLEAKRDLIRTLCIPPDFRKDDVLFDTFIEIGKLRGLNPLLKQLYCIPRGKKPSIEVGIDGLRLIAARTGLYAGSDPYVYDTTDAPHPTTATCTVWKLVGGDVRPFTATVRWDEFYGRNADGKPINNWATMPYHMLGKTAEAHALRKAFPEETSGLYISEEMEQADNGPRPDAETLPSGLRYEQFARLDTAASAKGVHLTDTMDKEQIIAAIEAAGGPRVVDRTWRGIDAAIKAMRPPAVSQRPIRAQTVPAAPSPPPEVAPEPEPEQPADETAVEIAPETGEVIPPYVGQGTLVSESGQ